MECSLVYSLKDFSLVNGVAILGLAIVKEMYQGALRLKSEYNNIRAIASKVNGFGGQAFSDQVNAS